MINSTYIKNGLSSAEVTRNLKKYGYNEIVTKREFKALKILLSQFTSFLIIILIIAGILSWTLGETTDGIAIFAIVVINAIIGFLQEYKAENAINALKKLVIPEVVVIRNGQERKISVRDLVKDDIVLLSEGDKIPADLEIIEAFSLKVDESILTGESVPSNKKLSKSNEGKLFKGTLVVTGRTKAKVLTTGMNTEFGKIIKFVSKQVKTRSPLTIQLDVLGKKIAFFILILIIILFGLGMLRKIDVMSMIMTSIALGVSAIPEGLPIIVTLTLAMGVQALARKKAIVRKMNAIETLGATTIICSDKTGTLTLNEMTVKKIFTDFKETKIPGIGYKSKKVIELNSPEEKKLLEICENCNNSFVDKTIIGDPTEIALKILARKANYVKQYKEFDENVFTSERKIMSTLNKVGNKKEIFVKGAFEEVIKKCTHILKNGETKELTKKGKTILQNTADTYAKEALRVLAFAYKNFNKKFDEENLIFVGLVGMLDPPREEVKDSIILAQKAGIKIKIITGDNPITAKAIGERVGLKVNKVITGDQIDRLTDNQLKKLISETEIFARTSPEHKFRIVNLLKKSKEVVAVTGDGVNDAPALKHSDVGIAMGIKGTEATKEVADIILKDDNFSTIVNTIKEGRKIYDNIISFIKYMIASNFDEILTVGVITIMGYSLPILPLQILWINLATDSLPAFALGKTEADENIMDRPPHKKNENIFKKVFRFVIITAIIQTMANIAIFFYGRHLDKLANINVDDLTSNSHTRTLVFTEIVLSELFFVFVCKGKDLTIKSIISHKTLIISVLISVILQFIIIYTPFMQNVFKTVPLTLTEWGMLLLLASLSLLVPKITELSKKII